MSDGCAEVYFAKPVGPQKTWLDECAFEAMKALCAEYIQLNISSQMLAFRSYELAQAMLAEKQRIEKEETK